MKKIINILNLLLAVCVIISDMLYTTVLEKLWMKGIASGFFFLMGLINLIFVAKNKSKHLKFAIIMTIGLFVTMLADIILNLEFMIGAIVFALGHICYIFAYIQVQKFTIKDLIAPACIFVPSTLIITLTPIFNFGGILMEIVCIIYALIISCMVGKSISNSIKENSLSNIIITIGSILFFISDFMLLFSQFADVSRIFGVLCLATYYPAQAILAFSILYKRTEENNT